MTGSRISQHQSSRGSKSQTRQTSGLIYDRNKLSKFFIWTLIQCWRCKSSVSSYEQCRIWSKLSMFLTNIPNLYVSLHRSQEKRQPQFSTICFSLHTFIPNPVSWDQFSGLCKLVADIDMCIKIALSTWDRKDNLLNEIKTPNFVKLLLESSIEEWMHHITSSFPCVINPIHEKTIWVILLACQLTFWIDCLYSTTLLLETR